MAQRTPINSSRISAFWQLNHQERLVVISQFTGIPLERLHDAFDITTTVSRHLDGFVENCMGSLRMPLGIAPNFKINNRDYLIPMAVEETSVIAAAANGARMTYDTGGFESVLKDNVMIGQTQLELRDSQQHQAVVDGVTLYQEMLISALNDTMPGMVRRGGGVRSVYVRGPFSYRNRSFVVVQCDVAVADAMGANVVNRACERLGEILREWGIGNPHVCILSNLPTQRLVQTRCRIRLHDLAPESQWDDVARRIDLTQGLAEVDPYRAVTHNKGILNGMDAVLIATGNDWRANSSGALGYAAMHGEGIKPLSRWVVDPPYVCGEMTVPIQLGIVGGMTRIHPSAKLCLEILDVSSGKELAEVVAAVGLAQNWSAMRALSFEGITKGHMRLHQNNLRRHAEMEVSS